MASLAPLLDLLPDERVRALIDAPGPISVPDPARPYLLAALVRHLGKPVLAVTARAEEADLVAADVRAFLGDGGAEVFPGWEVLPGEPVSPSVDTMGRRLHVIARLGRGESFVVVTTAQGATQLVGAHGGQVPTLMLAVGTEVGLDAATERLVELGYERNYIVERRGEFAVRGGILDIFPPASERPVRAELWGDEVTSLRRFALASQRSLDEITSVDVTPCRELVLDQTIRGAAAQLARLSADPVLDQLAEGVLVAGSERFLPELLGGLVPLTTLLPAGSPVAILEPKRVHDRAAEVLGQVDEWERSTGTGGGHYGSLEDALAVVEQVLLITAFSEPGSADLQIDTWAQSAGKPEQLADRLARLVRSGYRGVVTAAMDDTADRLVKNLSATGTEFARAEQAPGPRSSEGGCVVVAELQRGFIIPDAKLALVAESDLTGRRAGAARTRAAARRRETTGPLDLEIGDLVVHEVHGIGRYQGLSDRELLGVHREYIEIEYARGDTLFVPSDQTDLVSKYIGGESPKINRLGSGDWARTKSRVRRRVREIAGDLVKLYSKRLRARGFAFGPDDPWQRQLEDSFPYEETPDQIRAIDEVKDDMEQPIPMDRLVCGDVGYGKTEIAVRAAFKAVTAGKQVAVLVPTTILAQQHYATFGERFRGFPVRIEMLSRFLTSQESSKVLTELAAGTADVVVGTHKLLQGGVNFSNLGLVIVDEEQRFGVEQKEKLKSLRASVDVLTMTATPIPRTLEMAMTGLRDMSIVDTPPENRHPVMTFVGDYSDEVVVSAIRRELLRDGQVFYVHHRVDTIGRLAARIQDLVPEARIGVAHGQMQERALEQTMLEFGDAKLNVLVCTTIIESGLDIPTVNTLIVERADLLGLSQMYQLRGRVGRAHERAYAYLFFPQDRALTEPAHERLKAIAEHTGLGSGFRIAMRDLEIRGAGNLLGAEQHGHISEIGFDLYVKLVAGAVDEAKGLPYQEDVEVRIDLPVQALIPKSYIRDENLRLEGYRKIAAARDPEDLAEVKAELEDRYGPPPRPVDGLFELARLRAVMIAVGVTEVATVAGNLRIKPIDLEDSKQVRLQRINPTAVWKPTTETLLIPESAMPAEGVVVWVRDLIEQLTSRT